VAENMASVRSDLIALQRVGSGRVGRNRLAKVIELGRAKKQPSSPLTPELREFIDAAIVPILVREFLALSKGETQLAERLECVAKSPRCMRVAEGAHHS
jgi:hypothetical protein